MSRPSSKGHGDLRAKSWANVSIYTVGHSTRSLDELVTLLRAFDIATVVDVRTIPRSLHNPQFGDSLRHSLRVRRVRYVHLPELGGLRHARRDSPNTAWRNASFRGYADYTSTAEFEVGLTKLRALTAQGNLALMCAEAVPWRCHRSLIADVLTVRGARVQHIMSGGRASPHRLTSFARVTGSRVVYPAQTSTMARLATPGPFHLEATVRALQRRPTNAVDGWHDNHYVRALSTLEGLTVVDVANRGTIDEPDLRLTMHGPASATSRATLERTVRKILGLDVDPEPLRRAVEGMAWLRPTARALRGMRPPRFAGLFEAFANVVPFQQLSLDAGVSVVRRFVERFGDSVEHDGRVLRAFPAASTVADARVAALEACGLSRQKADTIRRAARAIASGVITEEGLAASSSEDAMRTLMEMKGIGSWTAAVILLRGLGRLDVFPPGDAGAVRGLGKLMPAGGPPLERVLERMGERRGYLYFCVLGASLISRDLITDGRRG